MGIALVWLQGTTMFASGLLFGLDPIVSQAFGARNRERLNTVLGQGWILAMALTPVLALCWWYTEPFLIWSGQDPKLAAAGAQYARWLIPSAPFLMIFTVSRSWLQGQRVLAPVLVHALWANGLNVLLNYALIYGHFGAPAMGLRGAAVATSVTRVLMALALLGNLWRKHHQTAPSLGFGPHMLDGPDLRRILAIGIPIALQITFEMGAFGLTTLFAGQLGTVDASAHLVVLNMASITFMIPLGVSLAASTRVGNLIGEGELTRARRSARAAFVMGAAAMTVSGLVFYFGRNWLPRLYTAPDEVAVRVAAASILPIAAAFQVFDGIQVVGSGILRGAGQTRAAALFNLIGYWPVALPLGWWLTFRRGMGIQGLWLGLALGLVCGGGAPALVAPGRSGGGWARRRAKGPSGAPES
ncbi:MAG: MATE family efflux transporter [Planctomycetota bacterium]